VNPDSPLRHRSRRPANRTLPGIPEPPAGPIGVAILGSTGSVGRQALEVIAHHPDRFRVVALAAGSNTAMLAEQTARFVPDLVSLQNEEADQPDSHTPNAARGSAGLIDVATHSAADIVVVATSGHAAIVPTHHAIAAGKTIALANKETIVCAGELIIPFARERGVEIRPVDSEHSAIWQSLGRSAHSEISRLILTASGGPFRETGLREMTEVTLEQALAHPTWAMGGKITIDSATLMNKGLEVIEAHWLFDVGYDQIDVVIHPESIVHSLVEFLDGSQVAQLSLPDMRLPIQYALTYPRHADSPCHKLSLTHIGALHFAAPDELRFPALSLARQAGRAGGTYPTVLSAADEIAVEAFIAKRIRFTDIMEIVERVLDRHRGEHDLSFESIAAADHWARPIAAQEVVRLNRSP